MTISTSIMDVCEIVNVNECNTTFFPNLRPYTAAFCNVLASVFVKG